MVRLARAVRLVPVELLAEGATAARVAKAA
jgi:hypothetical protein